MSIVGMATDGRAQAPPKRPPAGNPTAKPAQPAQPGPAPAKPPASDPVDVAEDTQKQPAANPPPEPPLPGEVGPELYLLRDKQGRLQAVPGFSFEDFIELYRLKNRLAGADDRPRYVLSHSMITGAARGQVVQLSLVLTIDLNDAHWVRIPLGLSNSIVEGDAKLDGPGDVLVEFVESPTTDGSKRASQEALPRGTGDNAEMRQAADRAGYVLWLRGEPKKSHKVTIPLVTPVSLVGGETQLRLEAPRASVAQLVVETPVAGLVGRVSEGATLLEPQVGPNKTTFSVLGASGLVELAWRSAGSELAVTPSVLESSGTIWARIDGRSVSYEAKLAVRSFAGQFDNFRVRLPVGAQLIGNNQAGVSIVPVPTSPTEGQSSGTVVEVKLEKKTVGPIELRLLADRQRAADNQDESLELAGFDVLGAVRQSGNIGVQVAGNWQIVWGESRGVRQLDDVPESVRRDGLLAAFEFTSQPCSLMAKAMPRRTRVSVQPNYVLTVGARETRLAAELKYTIRGAKVRALTLAMPGWEIDSIGPANLVNVDAPAIEDATEFSVPLAQPSNGDLAITITARRGTPGGVKTEASQTLQLDLPRPLAEVVAPAIVVIQPADNVELTPRSEALVGLGLRSARPALTLPVMQQDPFFYQTEGASSKFVADFKVRAQTIEAAVEGRIDLDEQELQVEERLRYDISFEPVEKLTLRIPRGIPPEKVEVTLEGMRLALTPLREEAEAESRGWLRVSATLGGSRIGRCELVAAYRLPQEKLPPATSVPVSIPLIVPADGSVKQGRVFVRTGPSISVNVRKGDWKIDEQARGGPRQEGIWLTATDASGSVDLGVTLQDRSREAATLVERAWIQTWLTDQGRQDRAVFRLSTSERRLRIGLPAGVNASAVQASLDGKAIALEADSRGGVVVALPSAGVEQRHLLELVYHMANREPAGAISLEPPRLLPSVWSRRLNWQVILPGHEHLLVSSGDFTNESRWQWTGRHWQRTPSLNEQQLAEWIGLPGSGGAVQDGANCYVFSSVGEYPALKLWTARRSSLVFGASLAVLVVGLGLMYLRRLRNPVLLFAAAIGMLSLGAVTPDLAVLVAQAAALGAILIVVALVLARLFRPVEVGAEPSSTLTPITDRGATDRYYRTPADGAPPSTATAPMILPTAGAETAS